MSYSRLLNPSATCSMARIAAPASGARPRLVCRITPVALITRRSEGRVAFRIADAIVSTHCCSVLWLPPALRAASTLSRKASSTTFRGCCSSSCFTPAVSNSELTLGKSRRASLIWVVECRALPGAAWAVGPERELYRRARCRPLCPASREWRWHALCTPSWESADAAS